MGKASFGPGRAGTVAAALWLAALVALAAATPALAVDGQIEVSQAGIEAGAGFPHTISEPGSYKLTSNLQVPPTAAGGILITASDVTLDLNGFQILGPGAADAYGIRIGGAAVPTGVTIRNGTVRGMSGIGVHAVAAATPTSANVSCEAVNAIGNGGGGLSLQSGGAAVRCLARDNTGSGIAVTNGLVRECVAVNNTGDGINASASTVSRCQAIGHVSPVGAGIRAFRATVEDSACTGNAFGIRAEESTIRGSTVGLTSAADAVGIQNNLGGLIEGCTVKGGITNQLAIGIISGGTLIRGSSIVISGAGNVGVQASSGTHLLDNNIEVSDGTAIQFGSSDVAFGGNRIRGQSGTPISGSATAIEANIINGARVAP